MAKKFRELVKRSLVKSITFRVLVIMSDLIIIYLLTKRLTITLAIILFSNLSATIIYFVHERAWNKIHWGKVRKTIS